MAIKGFKINTLAKFRIKFKAWIIGNAGKASDCFMSVNGRFQKLLIPKIPFYLNGFVVVSKYIFAIYS